MRIGIIGSGHIGGTAAGLFTAVGHDVRVGSRGGPVSYAEAAEHGELVLLAIPFHAIAELPHAALDHRIVIDANNYYPERDGRIEELDDGSSTSSELLDEQLSHARLVKAFNTMYYATLAAQGMPGSPREDRLVLFVAGDDPGAKQTVAQLIEEIGFAAVDTGSLAEGGRLQQPGNPIYNVELTPAEAAKLL